MRGARVASSARITSALAPSARPRVSIVGSTSRSGSRVTSSESKPDAPARSRVASRGWNRVRLPRPSSAPFGASPTPDTTNCSTGPVATIPTEPPTSTPVRSAVRRSRTTWPGAGAVPSRSATGATSGSSTHDTPTGAPKRPSDGVPSGAITMAWPATIPAAAATPSNARTSSRTSAGTRARLRASSNVAGARTTTSAAPVVDTVRSSARSVSVSTRLPTASATPSTTARPVAT